MANGIKELSVRDRLLIIGMIKGLSASEAARRAGYAESTVRKQISRIVGKSSVQDALDQSLGDKNVTFYDLVAIIKEGLDAKKTIAVRLIDSEDSSGHPRGKKKRVFVEIPDHRIRLKFAKITLTLLGLP
ncbi:MAG: hypothetical protein HZA77_12945 [Candidatus Schekmanbacteria bacterium]|nr:hypothetical protein [Candidatus Schekmanbacteria bacterium]